MISSFLSVVFEDCLDSLAIQRKTVCLPSHRGDSPILATRTEVFNKPRKKQNTAASESQVEIVVGSMEGRTDRRAGLQPSQWHPSQPLPRTRLARPVAGGPRKWPSPWCRPILNRTPTTRLEGRSVPGSNDTTGGRHRAGPPLGRHCRKPKIATGIATMLK